MKKLLQKLFYKLNFKKIDLLELIQKYLCSLLMFLETKNRKKIIIKHCQKVAKNKIANLAIINH